MSIIFHVAANVRFDEKFKVSTIMNVNSTATILNIAKYMPNLKVILFLILITIYNINNITQKMYMIEDN